jgi:3-(3-hydroxy-phenyl)propionate hydroxylase
MPYEYPKFEYRRSPDQDTVDPVRYPVVISGAGPVGLALAVDLALKQVPVVLLEAQDTISVGSRAICFAKRTLEVCERLGLGRRLLEKGVTWKKGKVFFGDDEVFYFDLLPEEGHHFPAFINL